MTTRIKHLYIHVPFCNSICYYCDFAHRVYDRQSVDGWLNRMGNEINKYCDDQYETIYIGGGTPSCLNYEQMDSFLTMIDPYSTHVEEYTFEVNPESLDENKIKLLKKHHINRISMGIQSSDDKILNILNRKHTFKQAKDMIALLKDNGFNNISVDLMYSLPSQDMEILNRTLKDIIKLDVPHISIYSLTIEENTVFYKKRIKNLDEDLEADMYELIDRTLRDHDYIHYEVSNFCRKGYESKHNLGYWRYDDFLGLSVGASGKIGNNRYTNTRDLKRYIESEDIRDEDLYLSVEEMKFENIMMSLRTIYGLDIEEFNQKYHCDLIKEYPKGISNKYIEIHDGKLICTNLELLNNILLDFME